MNIFEDIKLVWGGQEFTIPANRVMKCIAAVEEIITLGELHRFHATGAVPMVRLSQAFAVALRHAGAKVTDEEVYLGMFDKGEMLASTMNSIGTLLVMMVPPGAIKSKVADDKVGDVEAKKAETPPAA